MVERPILFSAPMVRAILDGRKTQTRRVAKLTAGGHVKEPCGHRRWHPADPEAALACPFGAPGDRLWVRETWQHEDGSCDDAKCGQPTHIYCRATETYPESMRWRPAIFMQRWASRITLEVTAVRVERLHAITHSDAIAEGARELPLQEDEPGAWWSLNASAGRSLHARTARAAFVVGWDSINGARAPWDSNPWVWVLEFERAVTQGD